MARTHVIAEAAGFLAVVTAAGAIGALLGALADRRLRCCSCSAH